MNPENSRLLEAVSIIFRRKLLIAAVTAGITLMGVIILFLMPKKYDSEVDILLDRTNDSEKAMLFRVNLPNFFDKLDWVKAEVQIMKSRPVAEATVDVLGLDNFATGDLPLDEAELKIVREECIENLRENIRATQLSNSAVLRLRYESFDPKVAARVLNQVVHDYRVYRNKLFRETEEYEFYSRQLADADRRLQELEAKQSGFKGSETLFEPKSQGELLLKKLSDYQSILNNIQTTRIGKESRLAIMRDKVRVGKETIIPATEISDSPSRAEYLTKLKSELYELQMKRDELLRNYSPTFSEVVEVESRIATTEEKFFKEIEDIIAQEETSIKVLQSQENKLNVAMDSIRVAIKKLSTTDYELTQISRGIEDTRELYSMLLRQRDNARLSMEKAQHGLRVLTVSPPTVPLHHSRPKRRLGFVLSIVIGLLVGMVTAFVLEYVNKYSEEHPDDELSTFQRVTAALLSKENIHSEVHSN
ncbi:GumC family protein [candidate division KSB1 bacterium]|nr:GumC family protein [candidate division KSB1 bacterium]